MAASKYLKKGPKHQALTGQLKLSRKAGERADSQITCPLIFLSNIMSKSVN